MQDTFRHQGLRKQLVKELREQGIQDDTVLSVIEKIPRHFFIDESFEFKAYENIPFPIGKGQTISNPFTVAYQTELLAIEPGDKVLEIGTGSGYQAAVLAEMDAIVYTIERHESLKLKTEKLLQDLGYNNIKCFYGDGFEGLVQFSPFDKIVITAAAPEIPKSLLAQLEIGGYMVIPFGSGDKQQMMRIKRIDKQQFEKETFDYFTFVPMLKGIVN